MGTFVQQTKATQQTISAKSTIPARAHFGQSRELNSVYRLQRTIGNQAVQRLLQHVQPDTFGPTRAARFHFLSTFPVHVQRDEIEMEGIDLRPGGLLVEKRIKGVTNRWVALWRSKKDSTIRELLEGMLAILNTELGGLRVAPIGFDPTPSKTEGEFNEKEWRMEINLDIDLGRKVNFDERPAPCR
jgi:hypothetical protein